jgi:hypothetical protein
MYPTAHCKQLPFLDFQLTISFVTPQSMDGGMELLLSLVSFDPQTRATALDVLNSSFMEPLRESPESIEYCAEDEVYSYMAFSTQN